MAKQWTKEEIVTLGKLRRSGTSYRAISEVIGRTPASCHQQAFKMGICKPHRKAQPERQLEMDFRESPKTQQPMTYVPTHKPKPAWWSAMMWWRK